MPFSMLSRRSGDELSTLNPGRRAMPAKGAGFAARSRR
jgi:hypothetical protein